MKSSRTAGGRAVQVLAIYAVIAMLAVAVMAGRALAATGTPLDTLSLDDRLKNAPDTTTVHIGPVTTTLGAARAAHRAREATLSQAAVLGLAAHGKLATIVGSHPIMVGATKSTTVVGGPPPPSPVVEAPSQYAGAPADMKAFCAAAAASACLYLPPDQQVVLDGDKVADGDLLVTQPQCVQEGGVWDSAGVFGSWCAYLYPDTVVVPFTPAANYKFTQSAHCDSKLFTYVVDDHGAISITAKVSAQPVTTGDDATCIVTVTPGG